MLKICNRIIEYSFYLLFLLVPLAFTSKTSELFELNKMWLTWALTILIVMFWGIKMVLQKKILFQRTPLDIPIGLFLLSQIISTIFSLDSHVSLWGYYSRFNGGLLSILSYVFLYYAFLSNSPTFAKVQRLMTISLISGLIVALWGLPSHFGYDPTCFLFRHTLDVSCWTAYFMPTIRMFSTLGQPDWLAAYLAILIPIAIVKAISNKQKEISRNKSLLLIAYPLSLVALFYVDLLFTRARSGILGVWLSLIFFGAAYWWMNGKPNISIIRKKLKSPLAMLFFGFLIITFVIGTPIHQIRLLTLEGIGSAFQKPANTDKTPVQSLESGGTDSANIRLLVWKGAINAWKSNPLIGSGVETFAFAYYKYKPAGQNLTSEWNFLYNKAHNEYLNFLATTGLFGLGTYLLMIGSFLFISFKQLKTQMSKVKTVTQNSNVKKEKFLALNYNFELCILSFALIASYISILITNFFGFSVVITNIYLFLIPAFVFVLNGMIPKDESRIESKTAKVSLYQWFFIVSIALASLFVLFNLLRLFRADIVYALGYNLDRAGEYQKAYPNLHKAVELRGDEPVFKDELSINDAIISASLMAQKNQNPNIQKQTVAVAAKLAQEAISVSNEVISKHPNNVVFWKTRTRLFFTLAQVDSKYLPRALDAIQKAELIAPQDANILYNLGILYGQNNNIQKGIEALEKTVALKPDYRDAHFALGLYYHADSQDAKAVGQMQYILLHINPQDAGALESIADWNK